MSRNFWYAWFPGDYARDTADLSMLEDSAYRRLLDHVMMTRTKIPPEPEVAFRICRAISEEERLAVHTVLSRFFPGGRNKRAELELQARDRQHRRLSEAGKKGNRRRWKDDPEDPEDGGGESSGNQGDGSPGDSPGDSGGDREANHQAIARGVSPGDRKVTFTSKDERDTPPPTPRAEAADGSGASEEPEGTVATSPHPPQPPGLEKEFFRGEILVVDALLHARLKRIAPERFLQEQYPVIDAKLANSRLPNEEIPKHRAANYATTIIGSRWSDLDESKRSRYSSPKPYVPPAAPKPVELTEEDRAAAKAEVDGILRGLSRGTGLSRIGGGE